jgi:hypothetical protein
VPVLLLSCCQKGGASGDVKGSTVFRSTGCSSAAGGWVSL